MLLSLNAQAANANADVRTRWTMLKKGEAL
jgi:hypothetical protein